jgi:predicted Zn-dependent peptidase
LLKAGEEMIKYILDNGIKLIYEHREGNLTSFCIGLNAGALEEQGYSYGTAHAVEHMLFKGTRKRSEDEINSLCDELFGFNNAMTNFPYVIYYGTLDSEDFHKGFELFSDIVMNPEFPKQGFTEEMDIIREELKDWKEDAAQYCEDLLLSNAFHKRRIRELIIGSKESIESFTLDELKNFYEKYYCPSNCVITVVSSCSFYEVREAVIKYMGSWKRQFQGIEAVCYEKNSTNVFFAEFPGMEGAKIQYSFNIDKLEPEEIRILNVFNLIFGDGVSSILYDNIRTKNGYAYEVSSSVKNERGIKLFTINVSTSKKHIEKVIELIDQSIEDIKTNNFINEQQLIKASKRYALKQNFLLERSVELSKRLTTFELMHGDCESLYEDLNCKVEFLLLNGIIEKVFIEPTIQVLK